MTTQRSQTDAIREALEAGRELTPLDALREFSCFRLGARIYDLKREGLDIATEMVETPTGKHIASYRLVRSPQQGVLPWSNT